jgi:hypothetical protein
MRQTSALLCGHPDDAISKRYPLIRSVRGGPSAATGWRGKGLPGRGASDDDALRIDMPVSNEQSAGSHRSCFPDYTSAATGQRRNDKPGYRRGDQLVWRKLNCVAAASATDVQSLFGNSRIRGVQNAPDHAVLTIIGHHSDSAPAGTFTYTSAFQYSLTSYLRTSSTQVVSIPCRGISRSWKCGMSSR